MLYALMAHAYLHNYSFQIHHGHVSSLFLDFTHPNEQLETNKSFQLCMFKDRTVIFESSLIFLILEVRNLQMTQL